MNPTNKDSKQDEASRSSPEASSSETSASELLFEASQSSECDTMKRAAARRLIERYFYQLTDGCGNPACDNEHCASSGEVKNLTPNQAAAQALQLFSTDARLCDRHPNKVARTHNKSAALEPAEGPGEGQASPQSPGAAARLLPDPPGFALASKTPCEHDNNAVMFHTKTEGLASKSKELKTVPYLTEERLKDIIESCTKSNCYSLLIRTLGEVYSGIDSLSKSFRCEAPHSPIDAMLDRVPGDLTKLKKEDVRTMQGEPDKDEDCQEAGGGITGTQSEIRPPLDVMAVRRAYEQLLRLPSELYEGALVTALTTLAGYIQIELQRRGATATYDDIIDSMVIVFEIQALGTGDYLETALPALCKAAAFLPVKAQAALARRWASPAQPSLRSILENLQQLVTLMVIITQFHREFYVQDELVITSATKLMKVVYYANLLTGVMDPVEPRDEMYHADDNIPSEDSLLAAYGSYKVNTATPYEDPLGSELHVNALDCRKTLLPFSDFYNEPLSDSVEMDRDFANYKGEVTGSAGKFSFMNYAFILTPATKTLGLYFDNRIRMYSERRISFIQSVAGQLSNPYLRLRVRRDHIIDDALVELEMIAMENPNDLKKQLVVEFVGEQGIDEGGVSKEFFQLIVEEIFNPDYGMFTCAPDSQAMWFSPTSFESDAQFTLVGIVLGLAIYNNIILAVNFPMVVYRKLMGKKGYFEDLQDWNPTVYSSLKQMLEYEVDDMEDVFMQTFKVCYQDVFGTLIHHELKENGDQINVTQANKQEFVKMYADFLLNKSVEKQFRAFHRGFQMVTDESPLALLFRPEEIELLVCGSKNFDFDELELATQYDGGYANDTTIIKDFWSIVHSLSTEDKRKLLQFTTGSDRVPLGGLSRLKLVIARNGPDSDRLPTAHTCFNVLLLPEYASKEKLRDRLVKAINYSKGFGML